MMMKLNEMILQWNFLALTPPGPKNHSAPFWADPTFLMMIMMGALFFMMIRSQSKKQKQFQKMIEELKTGDRVVFSGILGTIANVKEKTFIVKVADNTKVEVLKSSVTAITEREGVQTEVTAK